MAPGGTCSDFLWGSPICPSREAQITWAREGRDCVATGLSNEEWNLFSGLSYSCLCFQVYYLLWYIHSAHKPIGRILHLWYCDFHFQHFHWLFFIVPISRMKFFICSCMFFPLGSFKKKNRQSLSTGYILFLKKIIIYFLAALGLLCCAWASLVAASGGYSLLRCAGFSLRWLLLLWSTGSRCVGFSSCSTRTQ